jgi:hypothetical protein
MLGRPGMEALFLATAESYWPTNGTVEYQNSVLFKAIILSEAEQLPYHCIPL